VAQPKHPNEINRDYIRLLQVMGRFIKEEFAVAIRMTQEDAVEQLLHFAGQSRNAVLQEMGKELREFTYGPQPDLPRKETAAADREGVRYYRGAPVAGNGEEAEAVAKKAAASPAKKNGPTRVYRGRIING
jgi:hypothetical protein